MIFTDREAEWNLINGLVFDNDQIDNIKTGTNDFSDSIIASIFSVISHIIQSGGKADMAAIKAKFNELGKIDMVAQVSTMQPWSAANIEYYDNRIVELSKKRRIVEMMHCVKECLGDNTKTSEDALACIDSGLNVVHSSERSNMRTMAEIFPSVVKIIEERYRNRGRLSGIDTGFTLLNKATCGFQNSQLIIIAARPSVGKTALALNMAMYMSEKKRKVGIFSAEMALEQLAIRAISGVGKIDSTSLGSGYLKDSDFGKIMDVGTIVGNGSILIDDTPNISLSSMISRARKMKRKGVEIIFVDYLTLLKHGDLRQQRSERVGEVSKLLKGLARELHIPVVALSQVNRNHSEGAPTLDDLRQSGEIEEDADVVILMHRLEDKEDERGQLIRLNIAKNRTGPTDQFNLYFRKEFVKFENAI